MLPVDNLPITICTAIFVNLKSVAIFSLPIKGVQGSWKALWNLPNHKKPWSLKISMFLNCGNFSQLFTITPAILFRNKNVYRKSKQTTKPLISFYNWIQVSFMLYIILFNCKFSMKRQTDKPMTDDDNRRYKQQENINNNSKILNRTEKPKHIEN